MKAKDLITQDDLDKSKHSKECGLCELHSIAYERIDDIQAYACPHCGSQLDPPFSVDNLIVGETNGAGLQDGKLQSPDENINKMIVVTCSGCDKLVGFMPVPVQWNANHDVHYTGGKDYMNGKTWDDMEPDLKSKVEKSITQ